MKKYFEKSHFLSQKLIFYYLVKIIFLKKSRLFFYFRSHERLELLTHLKFGINFKPYSLDLAPDYELSEQHFNSDEEVKNGIDEWLASKNER